MVTIRFPPDSFDPDERVGVLDPQRSIQKGRDGVEKRRPVPATQMTYLERVAPQNVARQLDASVVCQIALARLVDSFVMVGHNLEALLDAGDIQSRSFKFSRVTIGWPRREEQEKPLPMATIIPVGDTGYAMVNLEAVLLERTEDAYGEGTVLRQVSTATQELECQILSAHHEERRAVRGAFELNLLAELDDAQTGRRVVVPEYYNRTVRMNLNGMEDFGDADVAQTNQYGLIAKFQAQVDVVQLVSTPGRIQEVPTRVTVGNALIDPG